jgi:hypothetical protein
MGYVLSEDSVVRGSFADPDHFGINPDPDPTFHFDTDPDPYCFKEIMYLKQYQYLLYMKPNSRKHY